MVLESPASDVEGEADGGGDRGPLIVEQVPLMLHFVNGILTPQGKSANPQNTVLSYVLS